MIRTVARLARASACVLAALALGGCYATVAEVVRPDAAPGSEYHEGYLAGVEFADDAWFEQGMAREWMDANGLKITDFAIQKALNNLPAEAVQNHSVVWVEAFRSGASTRFSQYREAAEQAGLKTSRWLATGTLSFALAIIVLGRVTAR
ncbi:hypothetical protein JXB37_00725 [candidate division WOR-3 bacterium]|nr:hypothetical protein [candidate division WOR-3 bacterium]